MDADWIITAFVLIDTLIITNEPSVFYAKVAICRVELMLRASIVDCISSPVEGMMRQSERMDRIGELLKSKGCQ